MKQKYIVNIMAHNEEETIEKAIDTVIEQETGDDGEIEIHVFANACTDRTEDIVLNMAKRHKAITLHSILEKGKVNAFRECISYFNNPRRLDSVESGDKLFFIDADITIPQTDVLSRLGSKLDSSQDIYLVAALPVPSSSYNQSSDFVSTLFRIRYYLQHSFRKNLVRGACNVIRWSVLKKIEFPEGLVSTDMFLECKLDGHFIMDHDSQVVTKLKSSLNLEVKRDLLHLIAREQVYHWRRKGLIRRLNPESAREEWFLSPLIPREYFLYMIKKKELKSILILSIWMCIYKFNAFRARKIFRNSLKNNMNLLDYWSTKR